MKKYSMKNILKKGRTMFQPTTCYIKISGVCNARCPYCVKGNGAQDQGQFMPIEDFERLMEHLSEHEMYPPSGHVNLYNWGEPFLHPQLNEILSIVGEYGLRAHLSSNLLRLPKLTRKSLSVMKGMTISLSGFSQDSYGRIHGKSLDKVLRNSETLLRWTKEAGCDWKPFVNWHRYRFNESEMGAAKEYFLKRGVAFTPTVAHLNDIHRTIHFLQNKIADEDIKTIEKDLFIDYLKDCMEKCTDKSWECSQWSYLSINERCEVLLCCGWSDKVKGSVLGSVFDLPLKHLKALRKSSPLCRDCLHYGITKYFSNQFSFSLDDFLTKQKLMKVEKSTVKDKIRFGDLKTDSFSQKKPLVSIGMFVYNGERWLPKSIASILAQSYKSLELVISDNASTDKTQEICREYVEKDSRVKYSRNEVDLGPYRNMMRVFELSTREFFMWASDHDLWNPFYISKCLEVLVDDPSVVLCYGRTVLIDEEDNPIKMAPDVLDTRGMSSVESFRKIIWELSWGNMVYGMFRSSTLTEILPVPRTLGFDLVLLGRVSLLGVIAQIDEPLFLRRKNRPDESHQEALARWKRFIDPKGVSLEVVAPWLMMSNAHLESVTKNHITDTEKSYLTSEVIKSCVSRFGNSIKQEIRAKVNSELNFLKKQSQNSRLDNINSLELVRFANIGRIFFPSLEGIDLVAGVAYLRMGFLDIAKQFARKELGKFPSSMNAKLLLDHIHCIEVSGAYSVKVMTWEKLFDLPSIKLYAGDLPYYKGYEGIIGLSLTREDDRHVKHDVTCPMPLPDNSVDFYQSEDVFEHIEYDRLLPIINEIYRALKPNSTFRLSMPDYGCDVLINRSVKDASGNVVFDPGGGGTRQNPEHVWFPRIDKVKQLLEKSNFAKFGKIKYLHYYKMDGTSVVNKIDYSKGHIQRTPDFDKRVQNSYRPMSMVIDLIKDEKKLQQAIIFNEKGEELFNKGDIAGALAVFKKVIGIDPSFATAHNNLGVLYWQSGELQKAIDHFEKALKSDPNDRDAILNYGNILIDSGKIEGARNLYSSYLQKNPNDEEVSRALVDRLTDLEHGHKVDEGTRYKQINALLFFLSPCEAYRPTMFSKREVFCGPDCETTTIGEEYRTIKTSQGSYNIRTIVDQLLSSQIPDLIVVKADATGRNFPVNLKILKCPKLLILGNTQHLKTPIQSLLKYALQEHFDFIMTDHKRHHLHYFKEAGFDKVFWLPGFNNYPHEQPCYDDKLYKVSFVGQAGRWHPYRKYVLQYLKAHGVSVNHFQVPQAEAAEIYAQSLINLNISLNGDLNLRVFEVLSSGGFLLTDRLSEESGLDVLFKDGEHLVSFNNEKDLLDKIQYFLKNPDEAREIAQNGYEEYKKNHTPEKKIRELMSYIFHGEENPLCDVKKDKRSVYIQSNSQKALMERVAFYEFFQEMHLTEKSPSILFWPGVDARIICDVIDMPRLKTNIIKYNRKSPEKIVEFSKSISRDKLKKGEVRLTIQDTEFVLQKLGTDYGGWVIPINRINSNSICYCVGAGEDISFDVELVNKTGSDVFVFDPTPRAQAHIRTLKKFIHNGQKMPINESMSEFYDIQKDLIDKIRFFPYGIWSKSETKTFFAPRNPKHVSHSILNLQKTKDCFDATCITIKDAMKRFGHDKVDLLKLDIEGAEYEVINSILKNNIKIGILCVEFDELNWQLDQKFKERIQSCISNLMEAHFIPLFIDGPNYTFINSDALFTSGAIDFPLQHSYLKNEYFKSTNKSFQLFQDTGVSERIKFIAMEELKEMNGSWSATVLTVSELLSAGLENILNSLDFRWLVITDGLDSLNQDQTLKLKEALTVYGFEKASEEIEAYYWKDKSLWGEILFSENRIAEAVRCFEHVLSEEPSHLNALNNLGVISYQLGNLEAAEKLLLRAAGLNRRDFNALINLSHVYLKMERFNDAAKLFQEAALLDSNNPSLWFHLGFCYEQLNKISKSIQAYKRCNDLNDDEWSVEEKIESLEKQMPAISSKGIVRQILSPKKILVINNLYPPQELGGYGRVICDFANILKKRGHSIYVLTSNSPYLGEIEQNESNVDRSLVLFGGWHNGVCKSIDNKEKITQIINKNHQKLQRIIKNISPDLCLLGNIDFLSHRIIQPLLENKIPVIHHLGSPTPGYFVQDAPQSDFYHLATASRWVKEEIIRQGYHLGKISVVYPGALVNEFKMSIPPAVDKLRIAYASIVLPYKGPHILVNALKKLHDAGIDFSCSLAGTTTDENFANKLKNFVIAAGMEEKVHFIGFLPREELKDFFARHNVLAFPSVFEEPFGISQVEAMAAGLLVVTSGTGGTGEIIEHGTSGVIFKSEDDTSLAQELLQLVQDINRWQRIAVTGQERAMKYFDIEKSVDIMEKLYCSLLK